MNIKWDSKNYTEKFSFVGEYGKDVLSLVDEGEGGTAVDLGCGNGCLTEKLAEKGYRVLGVDASEEMIREAKKLHPDFEFLKADAAKFRLEEKADVIFSNAVLHWIDADKQEETAKNIFSQLKKGGVFVCEFGGKGNCETVHSALEKAFEKRGLIYPRTFYFPSVGEYGSLLEKCGFTVTYAVLFKRPTEQKTDKGLENWIRMFIKTPFADMESERADEIIDEAVSALKDKLYINGKWFVDYVRIRVKAEKG